MKFLVTSTYIGDNTHTQELDSWSDVLQYLEDCWQVSKDFRETVDIRLTWDREETS